MQFNIISDIGFLKATPQLLKLAEGNGQKMLILPQSFQGSRVNRNTTDDGVQGSPVGRRRYPC